MPGAKQNGRPREAGRSMERKTGFEPATTTLARWGSTGLSYFREIVTLAGAGRVLTAKIYPRPPRGVKGACLLAVAAG